MIIGITGTHHGVSQGRMELLRRLFIKYSVTEIHHGCCIGFDAQAHRLALYMGIPIVGHPPDNPKGRARLTGFKLLMPEKPYLERNRNIVRACQMLMAGPRTAQEELRSGTWATVRFARKIGRKVEFVL